jgi:hypothetical protein
VLDGLGTLLEVLEPGAIILDDLDRVEAGGRLLHFLELAARTCRLVLATANCPERMMGAALRPGRFDEIVRVEHLDPEVLASLLAPDLDLLDRFRALPVAYVTEYVKRRRVLGRAQALAELDEVSSRARRIDEVSARGA